MKTKKKSRPLSREEGFNMISDYIRSGMGCSDYYHSHGVSEWQFYKWKRLYLQKRAQEDSIEEALLPENVPSFARLEVKSVPQLSSTNFPPIEIHYPNGIRLCIGEGLKEISSLAELVTLPIRVPCSR